jgi:hypothetical protein
VSVEWAPQPLIYDGGSNGLNVAQIWIDRANDAALVLMTNIGGAKAEQGLFAAAGELYRQYLAPGAPPLPTPVVADTPEEKRRRRRRYGSRAPTSRRHASRRGR